MSILTQQQSQILWVNFDKDYSGFQYVNQSLDWRQGVDGISQSQVLLTTFQTSIMQLSSWKSVVVQIRWQTCQQQTIESIILGVFCSLDQLLFYVCFEAVQIPQYQQIGIFGGRGRKVDAAYGLVQYTIVGSLVMQLAQQVIYSEYGSTDYETMMSARISMGAQKYQWLAFFQSFAIKIPMQPFHQWLPEAHVEAPTVGSVLLAGIIQKLGTYGFIRYSQALFPEACQYFKPLVYG